MSKHYLVVIQESWESLHAIRNEAGVMFLYHLLRRAPAMHPMLRGGMDSASRQLFDAVSFVVDNLQQLDRLVPVLRDHGRRHAEQGIGSSHYIAVRESLLLTLEYCLGDAFTAEVEEAWQAACNLLARLALSAAREQRPISAAA